MFVPVAGPRVVAAARAAAVALPLPLPAFRRPPKPVVKPARVPRERPPHGLRRRALAFVAALPDHLWLDRLVRGRAWIPLLGILLAGIVAAQVEILKLGASLGRALEQASTLTTQNEQLRGTVAALGDDQRIERLAGAMGLVLPPPGSVGYLAAARGGNVNGALGNIHPPDSAAFVIMPAKNGALITGAGTSTLPPSPGAPAPPPPATTATTGTTPATAATTATTAQTGSTVGATSSQSSTTPTGTASQLTAPSGTTTPQPSAASSATAAQQTPTQQTPTQQTSTQQAPATTGTPTGAAAIQPSSPTQTSGG